MKALDFVQLGGDSIAAQQGARVGAGANAGQSFVLVGGQHGVLPLISLGPRARRPPRRSPSRRSKYLRRASCMTRRLFTDGMARKSDV